MLQVAREVHSLIGGEVDHASTDEEDLPDNTKVVRRLAALNLLAGLGWAPALGFWEVRHDVPAVTWETAGCTVLNSSRAGRFCKAGCHSPQSLKYYVLHALSCMHHAE
jgi:hypothetical protein